MVGAVCVVPEQTIAPKAGCVVSCLAYAGENRKLKGFVADLASDKPISQDTARWFMSSVRDWRRNRSYRPREPCVAQLYRTLQRQAERCVPLYILL